MYSEEAEERAGRSAEKVQIEHEEEAKASSKFTEREFACREDAEQAIAEFESGLLASGFTENQVTRATCYTVEESSTPWGEDNRLEETGIEWLIEGAFVSSEKRVARLLKRRSLFMIATNELDDQNLSDEEMLRGIKAKFNSSGGFDTLKPFYLRTRCICRRSGGSWPG